VNPAPRFLTIDDVLTLHAIAIEDQDGEPSLRDRGLLESAVAMPSQQFGGHFLHTDIPVMAAAYAFHICKNHLFVDGNKRAATAAMIAFLSDNGWSFDATANDAEPVILQLAGGGLDKAQFADWARKHMHEKPKMELRDFFRNIDPDNFITIYRAIRPDAPGNTQEQFQATADEAVVAIPLIHHLIDFNRTAVQQNDESQRVGTAMMILALCTLYRLAESDMGYEW